ncbi:MAG: solute-binding protein [Caldiserica bacterium]|nr:solute-binding protein [Caldisericota bacterium]
MRLLLAVWILWVGLFPLSLSGAERIKMATTTSLDNSGFLDYLLPKFAKEYGIKIDVIAVGTGKALKLGENGDVDLLFVHAPKAEAEFVRKGFGVQRTTVMYNYFLIVGPPRDPAQIKGKNAIESLRRIYRGQYTFVSRGDESGTHKKEKELWKMAGLKPGGSWYLEAGQGMAATLQIADEKRGYTLVDTSTFLALQNKLDLVALSQDKERLLNLYSVMAVNPKKYPRVKYGAAMKFIEWISSRRGKVLIREFTTQGKRTFFPIDTLHP